jgi:chitin disaccharide deacetylase
MNAINPILRHFGFQPDDRVVVVHADDIGMCHATLPAIEELMAFGLVTSASAMVPCPWFPEVVAWHRRCPQFDLGIHLTLTSEWDRYRWGPVSTRSESTGLIDDEGYFHRTIPAARRLGRPESVDAELRGQVKLAERSGLVFTHLDTHMLVLICNELIDIYLGVACERRLPAFLMRTPGDSASGPDWALRWEERGQPVFDHWRVVTRRGSAEDHDAFVRDVFDGLPAGLSCVLLHPAIDTPEIRHITGDWRGRVADFDAFRQPSLRAHLVDRGIQLISYQPLRDAMRRGLG